MPSLTLSITGCTPGTPLMVNGTLSRRASSRARSAAGPLTSPVFASVTACTGFVAMKVARNVPVGARSLACTRAGDAARSPTTTIRCSFFIDVAHRYCMSGAITAQSLVVRKRKAFATTLTDDSAMAAAPTTGESRMPKAG